MVSSKNLHVAVFAFPFGTHAAPLLSLVRKLASSAPDVAFSFFSTAKSNRSLSTISSSGPTSNIKLYDVADGVPEDYVFTGMPQEEIELFMRATPENFRQGLEGVMSERGEERVSCVLSDSFLWFVGQIAEEMGVPWVSFWTSGACSLAAHFYTDHIRRTIGNEISTRLDEPLTVVPGFSHFRYRDLPEGIVFGPLDSLFSNFLHRMAQELPRPVAVVFNTIEGLDPAHVLNDLRTHLQKCLPVGPLSLLAPHPPNPDPSSCLSWLDSLTHAPATVAYVSFGTVMSPTPSEMVELAQGLEESGAHFLWSLKDKLKERLPAGFLDRTKGRGLVVPWAPQTAVLGHVAVGAFVTHCGWNSVLESITGGVPMICRPFFGDQRLNGRLLSHELGIGIGIEGGALTKDGVVDGLDLLLRKEEGKLMREKVGELKEMARNAVSETGSSTNNLMTLVEIVKGCC